MRLQLALNVRDLDAAVDFYSKLFNAAPDKIKPGYVNFAIDDPALKLVLFENPLAEDGSINHLGVETESAAEVEDTESRLRAEGVATSGIDDTICCYAEKVETWVNAPDGNRWEFYVKTADHDSGFDNMIVNHREGTPADIASPCCAPADAQTTPQAAGTAKAAPAAVGAAPAGQPGTGCCS